MLSMNLSRSSSPKKVQHLPGHRLFLQDQDPARRDHPLSKLSSCVAGSRFGLYAAHTKAQRERSSKRRSTHPDLAAHMLMETMSSWKYAPVVIRLAWRMRKPRK
jgi:hypothetical protein